MVGDILHHIKYRGLWAFHDI